MPCSRGAVTPDRTQHADTLDLPPATPAGKLYAPADFNTPHARLEVPITIAVQSRHHLESGTGVLGIPDT